jgi:alpha-L-rhamnosidase
VRARLHVTAKGLYAFQLNGREVGADHFANGLTNYHKRIDTLTYDVTAFLQPGMNSLEGLLATGWYAGRFPFGGDPKGAYGRDTALLVQMELTFADGSTQVIVSDATWESSLGGPIRSSSIYDGESYDARLVPTDWTPVRVEEGLGSARLEPKPFAPVRKDGSLHPVRITQPAPGHYVFDLGQNMVGWARLQMPVVKDHTVMVRYAEMLRDDGTLYTDNYRSAKSTDTYTAAGTGIVTWEPHFTFHGFRYVELSGLPEGCVPEPGWVTGEVLHADLPLAGRFTSSHAKLNQLQSNILWGWRGNSVDIPTDCPQRDERLGWTGDAQVFAPTALFNTAAHAFWKSWLETMRDEQDPDGAIPDVIPTAGAKFRERAPGWMDAATFIPWELYVRTGDVSVLADNFGMMERQVAWYRAQSVEGMLPNIKGYGDWLQPYSSGQRSGPADWMGGLVGDTPRPLLGSAFRARSVQILADAARVLGRTEDAVRYGKEAAEVRAAFTKAYFDAEGRLSIRPETQTAYTLAIAFDLLPESMRRNAGEHLARLVREAGTHLRTGFLGTPHLVPALDRTGHADLAAEVLLQETYPSWFFSINQGATTIWERWNSYTRADGFGDVSMNSFNHYAYGAIGQWMYERLAGLSPDPAQPGYRHFFVRPLVIPQLESARAEHETPYGKAVSGWSRKGAHVIVEVIVPPNTTATASLPGRHEPEQLVAGTYHFDCVQQ